MMKLAGLLTFCVCGVLLHEVALSVDAALQSRLQPSPGSGSGHSQDDYAYHLRVSSTGQPDRNHEQYERFVYDLNLTPTESVFGPNFHYTELGNDESGNQIWTKWVPSAKELASIQNRMYVDPKMNTVVKLDEFNSHVELYGVVNNARIRRRRRDAGTEEDGTGTDTHLMERPDPDDISEYYNDFIISPATQTLTSRSMEPDDGSWIGIEPELVFVLDYDMAQAIGGDRMKKLEYVAITVNGMNNHYFLTNSSVGIKCELVGLLVMKSKSEQPFMDESKLDLKYDENGRIIYNQTYNRKVIHAYQTWLHQNAEKVGHHDVAPLLSSAEFLKPGTGIAEFCGACRVNWVNDQGQPVDNSVAVVNDRGAFFLGIPVIAHELAHVLGSPHDGDKASRSYPDTTDCPFKDGYLMSYDRKVYTNQFRLSNCSLRTIRNCIRTPDSECLSPTNKTGRPTPHKTALEAGDRVTAEDICRKHPNMLGKNAVPLHTSPDQMCRSFDCIAINGARVVSRLMQRVTSIAPGNNMPCGNSKIKGKCRNGWCIKQGPAVDADALCKLLLPDDPFAYFNKTEVALSSICNPASKFPCVLNEQQNGQPVAVQTVDQNQFRPAHFLHFVVPGTPCGEGHVCFNQKCVSLDKIQDRNKDCVLLTGKQESVRANSGSSHPDCTSSIKCTYGSEFEYLKEGSTNNCTLEDGKVGVCSDGDCVHVPVTGSVADPELQPTNTAPGADSKSEEGLSGSCAGVHSFKLVILPFFVSLLILQALPLPLHISK